MNNLELDLFKHPQFADKCKQSYKYAQSLYAALCNNVFLKDNKKWSCSWRVSGSIVADLTGDSDYLDWYSSGCLNGENILEGIVTEEIKQDLLNIGWSVKDNDDDTKRPGIYMNYWP